MPAEITRCPAAILWDMDGVLADTTQIHYQSWRQALEAFGASLDLDQFLGTFGCKPADTDARLIPPGHRQNAADIRRLKDELFDRFAAVELHCTPGLPYWLDYFDDRCPQAVATSAVRENAEMLLGILGIRGYFQLLSCSDNLPGKPDPAVYLNAARLLGVKPENCLVFEDSPEGIEAARRANIPVIAVCTSNPATALTHADLVLPDLSCLTEPMLNQLVLDRSSFFTS
jgi:beta-phosphoglucomutase-like phosphatase (HAD superfamily)